MKCTKNQASGESICLCERHSAAILIDEKSRSHSRKVLKAGFEVLIETLEVSSLSVISFLLYWCYQVCLPTSDRCCIVLSFLSRFPLSAKHQFLLLIFVKRQGSRQLSCVPPARKEGITPHHRRPVVRLLPTLR